MKNRLSVWRGIIVLYEISINYSVVENFTTYVVILGDIFPGYWYRKSSGNNAYVVITITRVQKR